MIVSKKLSKFKEISHGFFNKKGGCSRGIYKSLNCGPGSNDYKTKVIKNLKIVKKKIDKNSENIFNSIDLAVKLAKKKEVSGIVTSPISKEVLSKFKKNFSGHTEYLAKSDKKKQFGMMLLNKKLRVVPFTTHVPLKNVHKYIKQKPLFDAVKLLNHSLKKNFNIKKPKIAVTGLNPHSGDGGLLGNEEQNIILPVIKKIKKSGISISGPLSPDSAFQQKNLKFFDAFLCMYHDQHSPIAS